MAKSVLARMKTIGKSKKMSKAKAARHLKNVARRKSNGGSGG